MAIVRRHLAALLALSVLVGGGFSCRRSPAVDPDLIVESYGGDFALTGDNGRPVSLQDFRGKLVLLFFGYTACPDVCPTTLSRLARAYALFVKEGIPRDEVQTVLVTVDPARDTPEKLRKYLTYFGVNAVGATGSEADIARVAKSYGAAFWREDEPNSAAGYLMSHSSTVYLIDRVGKVRHAFGFEDSPERIAELVVRLGKENCCTATPLAARR